MSSLRIAVADDDPVMREFFQKTLTELGHVVVGAASTGSELVELCNSTNPEMVIADIKMPGCDGIDACSKIYEHAPIPLILVSGYVEDDLIQRAEADHVLAYLVKPIKKSDLAPAIALAHKRFEQFDALRKEAADLRQALADRKVIERAKGILMKRSGLDEHDAFRRLQKLSSEKNLKLASLAQMIVTAEEALAS